MNYEMEMFEQENQWLDPDQDWIEARFSLEQLQKLFLAPPPETLKELLKRDYFREFPNLM